MGLGYQWSLDFVNPLNLTTRHNLYVLVMIEHFSKWLELVLLIDYNNAVDAYACLDKLFNRFGLPVEDFINQGTKFCGEFEKLCEKALIDH
jgi:hypothetical protein